MKMDPITVILLDQTEDQFIPTKDHYIGEILEEICRKHGLDPYKHVLSYNSYYLPYNFSLKTLNMQKDENLRLEEDFRPSVGESITVTLKVKDSNIAGQFNPDVTLWRVVKNLVAAVTLKIPLSTPILIRKSVEYIGREDLKKVTLRSLGYTSGYLFFRFLIIENAVLSKRTGGLLGSTESMQFEVTKNLDDPGSLKQSVVSQPVNAKIHEPVITFYPGIARRNSSVFGEINYLGQRNAVACRLPTKKLTPRQKQHRKNFYGMHVEDIKTMFTLVDEKRKELEERMIRPFTMTSNKEPEKKKKFTVIRIQFPDKTVLQGVFDANDHIREVEEFIKLYSRVKRGFQLTTGSASHVLSPDKTLEECGLVPTGKMFYKLEDDQHVGSAFLMESVLRKLTSHEGACYAAALCQYRPPEIKTESELQKISSDERMVRRSVKMETSGDDIMLRPIESRKSTFKF